MNIEQAEKMKVTIQPKGETNFFSFNHKAEEGRPRKDRKRY